MKRIPKWSDDLIGRVVWHEYYKMRGVIEGPVSHDGSYIAGIPLDAQCRVDFDGADTGMVDPTPCKCIDLEVLDPPDETCRTCKWLIVATPEEHPYTCARITETWVHTTGPNARMLDRVPNVLEVTTDFGCKLHEEKEPAQIKTARQ